MGTRTMREAIRASSQRWRPIGAAVGRQLARLAGLLLLFAALAMGLAAVAIGVQSGHDETRSVDMVLVLAPALPPAPLVERSLDLYRRGYALELLLAGPGAERVRSDLLAQGVPAESLLAAPPAGSWAPLIAAAQAARQRGARSTLVVSAPAEQLLGLKIAGDQSLTAYGAPAGDAAIDPLELARAAAEYWRYLLLGR